MNTWVFQNNGGSGGAFMRTKNYFNVTSNFTKTRLEPVVLFTLLKKNQVLKRRSRPPVAYTHTSSPDQLQPDADHLGQTDGKAQHLYKHLLL